MPVTQHISRICPKCGAQLQIEVGACAWCHTLVSGSGEPQRIRVRKKRSAMNTYFEHVRRHWIYFLLAVLAAAVAAWLLIDFAQRPERQSSPAPASIVRFP